MPNISLPTGKVIYVSTYEYFFKLQEEDVDEFFQSAIADDLGIQVEYPFSNKVVFGTLEINDIPEEEIEELEDIS